MNDSESTSSGRRIAIVDVDEPTGDQGSTGTFGAWGPGVLDEFLATLLKDRKATTSGVLVGRELSGRPQIDGVITTVQGGRSGQVAFDRESWGWVHESRASHYPDSAVIGWFCARPGVCAIPTEVDVQTHAQFLPNGDYVLLCVDPISLRVGAYVGSGQRMVSIGSGDLHQMLGVAPTTEVKTRIPPELIGAGLIGLAIGVVCWALTGAGSWPF